VSLDNADTVIEGGPGSFDLFLVSTYEEGKALSEPVWE